MRCCIWGRIMNFVRIGEAEHTWASFTDDWTKACAEYDEEFEDYASSIISVLKPICGNLERRAGVFAVFDEGAYHGICQLNCTTLPGYTSPVLRMRHLTISPHYDLGTREISEYAVLMVETVIGIWRLSEDETSDFHAKHIKFHMKSPADKNLFLTIGQTLGETERMDSKMYGGWLELTKR